MRWSEASLCGDRFSPGCCLPGEMVKCGLEISDSEGLKSFGGGR